MFAAILASTTVLVGPAVAAEGEQEPGHFRTRVSPHLAGVFVEGKYHGAAYMFARHDDAIELAPGVYNVELVDPRYKKLQAKVTIESGQTSTLRRAMEPLEYEVKGPLGELRVDGFGNAAVYLDGKYYANAKEFGALGRTLLLRPGTYRLEIKPADGSVGRTENIEIRPDMMLTVGRQQMYEEQ